MSDAVKCIGCGVPLQDQDPKALGYVPKMQNLEKLVCKRCFRLKHYNEMTGLAKTSNEYLQILHEITMKDALIVNIVDVFDFNGSWIDGVPRFVKGKEVLLIGNKVDLLPKSIKHTKIMRWMKAQAKEYGLFPNEIMLASSKSGAGVEEAVNQILEMRKGKDVIILGTTNVGKSTFINRLIQKLSDTTDEWITTSHFPGTTLDVIEIPLDDRSSIYDTPGIVNEHQLAHYVGAESLKTITPKKEVKAMVYQLNEGQTLFFGGLARFDFVKGERTAFVAYASNELNIHRTKLERADELYENHVGELLSPPTPEEAQTLPPFTAYRYTIKEDDTDVVISGLGWITVPKAGVQIVIHAPKGVGVFLRKSLLS